MKRRGFIKKLAIGGIGSITAAGCSMQRKMIPYEGPGFDLHPFIRNHPEAVFIKRTSVLSKEETQEINDTGYRLADEIIVKTESGGYPVKTRITCKPNWTCNTPVEGKSSFDQLGINTDTHFIEGFLRSVRTKGPQEISIHECACPQHWTIHGWSQMAERNNFIFRDLVTRDFWEMNEGKDYLLRKVPDGVVFKEVAFQAPITEPDTFLINIAKLKTHGMGITGVIKNTQGTTCKKFHQYCGGHVSIFKSYDRRYHKYFHRDYLERIAELHKRHVKDGIPRWDKENDMNNGFYMEQWVQRMLDQFSITPTGINIIEGIYGRDGNGFVAGPHDGKAKDYMTNLVIFGIDAFRVDIIAHWLAGHEPGNFGLFHLGIERGLSNVLDPNDIPVYLWDEGRAVLTSLEPFPRTQLRTYYLTRDYNGQDEPYYHMVDEPFDYAAWKSGVRGPQLSPTVSYLGRDAQNKKILHLSVPDRNNVSVNIRNCHGELVWRLRADDLEPGIHEVVWDNFSQPGIYNVYVKGMGWDAENEIAIYS